MTLVKRRVWLAFREWEAESFEPDSDLEEDLQEDPEEDLDDDSEEIED